MFVFRGYPPTSPFLSQRTITTKQWGEREQLFHCQKKTKASHNVFIIVMTTKIETHAKYTKQTVNTQNL